jgi:predicted unusual protein kinase regulating ubiquinone biosynthesis (AarF/ABC1/UbiB family)
VLRRNPIGSRRFVPPLIAAVLASLAVAGAAWWRARTRGTGSPRAMSRTNRLDRNLALVGLGARAGSSYASHRAVRLFADAERRAALDTAFELRTAEQVAETLGQMKGALMKLGQMASYLDQGLPEPVRAALADLQANAPPMSAELAAGMIRTELGDDPERLFAQWDPVPIASASIGQVHRAITHDGQAVAVKVQYPGVEEAMGADLANVGLFFAGMGQIFKGLDHGPLVAELRERLTEELDYLIEADNQREFAAYYEGHPTIHIPAVIDRYSTRRVLTTELATGARFDEVLAWDQDQRNLVAETLYRFAFGSLYRLGLFNGDPHPGNYLFGRDGHITFLDFGLVKRFTPGELDIFGDMIKAMVIEEDHHRFRQVVEQIGLISPDAGFTDEQVADYLGHFYDFLLHDGPYTITPAYASETVRRFFDTTGPYAEVQKAANLPPFMVVIQRINLGLYALFGELEATLNWRRLAEELWPFVEAAPATPMGRRIAAWRRQRDQDERADEQVS